MCEQERLQIFLRRLLQEEPGSVGIAVIEQHMDVVPIPASDLQPILGIGGISSVLHNSIPVSTIPWMN